MPCQYCEGTSGKHDKRCPEYYDPNQLYCEICGEAIDEDEEYWVSPDGFTLCEACNNLK